MFQYPTDLNQIYQHWIDIKSFLTIKAVASMPPHVLLKQTIMEFLENWLVFYKTKHAFSTQKFVTLWPYLFFCTKNFNVSTLEILSGLCSMKTIIGSVPSRQFRRASRVQFCRLWNQNTYAGFWVLNHMLSNACKKYFSSALIFIS